MNLIQSAQTFVNRFLHIFKRNTQTDLTQALQMIVDQAQKNASWSSTIPKAIKIGKITERGMVIEGSIIIDLKEAPEAAAFEYGSGEHATKGNAGKYKIEPKNTDALAFFWPGHMPPYGSKKFIGMSKSGKFLFHYVEHPGVEARPYLQPAIEQMRPQFKKILAKSFKDAYLYASVQGGKR